MISRSSKFFCKISQVVTTLSFHAINAIVDEAADATADRVAVNAATIVNEAAHSVAGRVSANSDEAEGLVRSMIRSSTPHRRENGEGVLRRPRPRLREHE